MTDPIVIIWTVLLLAAVAVMYYEWRVERRKRIGAERVCLQKDAHIQNAELCLRAADLEISVLRNDLHAAINARKAKSRGRLGQLRKKASDLIQAHDLGASTFNEVEALRSVLDSEAPNA